jgi:hypothetical protein
MRQEVLQEGSEALRRPALWLRTMGLWWLVSDDSLLNASLGAFDLVPEKLVGSASSGLVEAF